MSPVPPEPPPTVPEAPSRSGRRITPRTRRWLWRGALEAVLILFSVILALAVTNWAEERRTAARVEEMRGFLMAEMRANRDTLKHEWHLPHHERLRQAFRELEIGPGSQITMAQAQGPIELFFSTGLHPAPLRNAVWTSASGGDLIEHMDPREVFAMAEIYEAQAQLRAWNDRGYENAMGILDLMTAEELANVRMLRMAIYLEDLTSQEERLISRYDQALTRMGDPPPAHPITQSDDGPAPKR